MCIRSYHFPSMTSNCIYNKTYHLALGSSFSYNWVNMDEKYMTGIQPCTQDWAKGLAFISLYLSFICKVKLLGKRTSKALCVSIIHYFTAFVCNANRPQISKIDFTVKSSSLSPISLHSALFSGIQEQHIQGSGRALAPSGHVPSCSLPQGPLNAWPSGTPPILSSSLFPFSDTCEPSTAFLFQVNKDL